MARLATLAAALAIAVTPSAAAAVERTLYRWVDSTGKVHYTDALPPEAVNKARAELSARTGLVRAEIGRALTAEERRALEAEAAASAAVRTRRENLKRADEAKVSSFRSEDDLRAVYGERKLAIDETLDSLEAALASQRGSLHQQLAVAGDAELAGRPIAANTLETIVALRRELANQEQARIERAAEKQVLNEEMERLVELFRERQQRERELASPDA
jgi:hypothetical protein